MSRLNKKSSKTMNNNNNRLYPQRKSRNWKKLKKVHTKIKISQ